MQFLLTTEKIRTNDLVKFALSDIKPNKQKDGGTQELGVPYSRLSKMWTGIQISLGAPFVVGRCESFIEDLSILHQSEFTKEDNHDKF